MLVSGGSVVPVSISICLAWVSTFCVTWGSNRGLPIGAALAALISASRYEVVVSVRLDVELVTLAAEDSIICIVSSSAVC